MQNMENVYEKDAQTEQGSEMNKTQGAEIEKGLTDLGKFKDVNALLQAYQSLQAEFTRRSQRLKQYETADNQTRGKKLETREDENLQADAPKSEVQGPASTVEEKVEASDTNETVDMDCENKDGENTAATHAAETLVRERVGNTPTPSLYEQVMANEDVRLKIIGDYLSSIGKSTAPITKGGVGVLTTPVKKANSVLDAGKLTLAFLKNGKQEK